MPTSPTIANLITQLIVFIALMFSPINFPADRLPGWLQTVHQVLPFQYMAEAVRDTLATPTDGISVLPFAVLAAWCVLGLTITLRIMTRRA